MYAVLPSTTHYQGDILLNYNFITPPIGKPYVFKENGTSSSVVALDSLQAPYAVDNKEKLIVNSFLANAMIITQTCDLQRRDFISVCPVFPFTTIKNKLAENSWGEQRINSFITDIKSQKVNYYFYLPPYSLDTIQVPESYVDLQVINAMPLANLSSYSKIISLSDKGIHWLGFKLSFLFARPYI